MLCSVFQPPKDLSSVQVLKEPNLEGPNTMMYSCRMVVKLNLRLIMLEEHLVESPQEKTFTLKLHSNQSQLSEKTKSLPVLMERKFSYKLREDTIHVFYLELHP